MLSTGRHKIAAAVVLGVVAWSATSAADPTECPPTPASVAMPTPHLRLTSGPGTLIAPSGLHITIPQYSHVLDGPSWDKLDAEVSRLQAAETSLTAENGSLKSSVESPWAWPGYKFVVAALVVGALGGAYAYHEL